MSYDDHGHTHTLKHKGQGLVDAPLPPLVPHTYKPRVACEKKLYMRETWVERTIGKSKPIIALLLDESNTSEEVKSYTP